jgi:hypothetical protein
MRSSFSCIYPKLFRFTIHIFLDGVIQADFLPPE